MTTADWDRFVNRVRRASWEYLSPDVAEAARMSMPQLTGFLNGSYRPTPDKIMLLAKRIHAR